MNFLPSGEQQWPCFSPIFDAHCHIIDPGYPLIANQGYLPDAYPCQEYQEAVRPLGITGGAVVSGSFQGFDTGYLSAALTSLGPGFVGVVQLHPDVTDETILSLHRIGVRAVRFNLYRGDSAGLSDLDRLAHRVYDLCGWHVELYVDSIHLPEMFHRLLALPKVSIDHLGLSSDGFPTLLSLVERGAWVKATGFGRLRFPLLPAIREICAARPEALLFGTDLPSTRALRPFQREDILLLVDAVGEPLVRRVLHDNAVALYRPLSFATTLVG